MDALTAGVPLIVWNLAETYWFDSAGWRIIANKLASVFP